MGPEKISAPLGYAWGVVGHLNGVKNSDELRKAHAAMQPKVVEATQKLGQSAKVYAALEGLTKTDLTKTRKRVVDASLRSMRLGGVALEGDAKDAYNANQVRLSELSTQFSNNVLDATRPAARAHRRGGRRGPAVGARSRGRKRRAESVKKPAPRSPWARA